MSLLNHEPAVAQILFALDAASHNLDSVESAVTLAVRLQAELQGLFVEDTDLLRIAELPFAREVVGPSGHERQLSGNHMARSLRAQASQARELLSRA